MKRYLYCIHYRIIGRRLKYPESLHVWFEDDPNDSEIYGVIRLNESISDNSEIESGMYYYKVFDRSEDIEKLKNCENDTRT